MSETKQRKRRYYVATATKALTRAAMAASISVVPFFTNYEHAVLVSPTLAAEHQTVCGCSFSSERIFSQHHSSQTNNRSIILTSSDAGARSVQFKPNDRFDEQGAFFTKGLIGLVVFALVYAVLKRF